MIFILAAALIALMFINKTRVVVAVLSLMTLAIGALSLTQTNDPIHQGAVAGGFGIWLVLCAFMFRVNGNVDRLRIHKG
ncbi:MAG: hypothetical protein EOP07_02595 [Proteobacteria bacterium]|nr:MAG: hypothetical protein EOP07_02595 [Pseudomonadota bacterium]